MAASITLSGAGITAGERGGNTDKTTPHVAWVYSDVNNRIYFKMQFHVRSMLFALYPWHGTSALNEVQDDAQ